MSLRCGASVRHAARHPVNHGHVIPNVNLMVAPTRFTQKESAWEVASSNTAWITSSMNPLTESDEEITSPVSRTMIPPTPAIMAQAHQHREIRRASRRCQRKIKNSLISESAMHPRAMRSVVLVIEARFTEHVENKNVEMRGRQQVGPTRTESHVGSAAARSTRYCNAST